MNFNLVSRAGDICNYWNKLVIVHKIDSDGGWAEVIKINNPNVPYQPSGEPFSVRLTQLHLVKSASSDSPNT